MGTTPTSKKSTARPNKAKPKRDPHIVEMRLGKDESEDDAVARVLIRPEVQAGVTMQLVQGEGSDVNALIRQLEARIEAVNHGDMSHADAALVSQAQTLDQLFNTLAKRAYANMVAGHGDAADRYFRLALKAQSQCRTTWETLAEIKNPRPVAFVRQANISHGPQQVNNGMAARVKNVSQPIELSGGSNELLPDARASQAAGGIDTPMEALGKLDGAEIRRG